MLSNRGAEFQHNNMRNDTTNQNQQNNHNVQPNRHWTQSGADLLGSGANGGQQMEELTPVAQLFEGQSIFVTGASGFIGRVLLEKLLRSYQGIKRIYILLRPKKNLSPYERLHEHLLRAPIFDAIRALKNGHELLDKIEVVSGDIGDEHLGLSEADSRKLLADPTLSVVFHSAASVRFDEPLKTSIRFNLQATESIVKLCKQIKNLRCLCHVSTAYVNSDIRDNADIEERLYPMRQQPEQLIKLAQLMDDNFLQRLKPELVGQRPNTYTYTKALAEHLIALEASDLPVAIVRPSIVVAAWREPLRGWVDNLNGPTGLVLAIGKGLLRTMRAIGTCKADIIPVDIVVNTMIAAAHFAAQAHKQRAQSAAAEAAPLKQGCEHQLVGAAPAASSSSSKAADEDCSSREEATLHTQPNSPPIFHCTSGDVNPITWGAMESLFWPIILKYPSEQVLRYPGGTFKQSKVHDMIVRLFVHFLPALMLDLICLVTGKKRQMLLIYGKLHRAIAALDNFCTTNYNFRTSNLSSLQASLTHPLDRSRLYMDISTLNWFDFWDDYVLGAR